MQLGHLDSHKLKKDEATSTSNYKQNSTPDGQYISMTKVKPFNKESDSFFYVC